MTLQDVIDEIKLELTGHAIELGIPDTTLAQVVKKALRELQRYISSTQLITVPFASCIDLGDTILDNKVSSITRVFRAHTYSGEQDEGTLQDPMMVAQWQLMSSGGDMYRLNDYMLNFASWNTTMQIRNTMSTDMAFREDRQANKLYINTASSKPSLVTIEYVPVIQNVEDIKSDYWIDILVRLATALTKQTLGRIRTRYTQSNALWSQDGQILLSEATDELNDIRTKLADNSLLSYAID